jgi:hypothetical protein
MKKLQLLILALLFSSSIFAQNIPVDFEEGGNGADWTWTTFENTDNPPLEIIENPFKTGINTSNTIAKFTARVDGEPHAGCESLHGTDIGDYKIEATNSTITIMVYKSVKSDVGIKLATSSGWSKGELKVANTKINEWEELTFDFSTVDHENMTYDQMVIFMDFNARSEETVNYFDNLTIGGRTLSIDKLDASAITIFPNPATQFIHINTNNSTNKVSKLVLSQLDGTVVLEQNETLNKIDVSTLAKGMYLLQTYTAQGILTKKVTIQ